MQTALGAALPVGVLGAEGVLAADMAALGAASVASGAAGSSVRLQAQPSARTETACNKNERMASFVAGLFLADYDAQPKKEGPSGGGRLESLRKRAILARMFGCRTAYGVGGFALALGAALGCGGSVVHGGGDPGLGGTDSGVGGSAGAAGSRAGSGGKLGGAGSAGSSAQAGRGGASEPEPIDTGCPDVEPPPPDLQCDPFQPAACGVGFGCYPYVQHPEGGGCEQQRYGTACGPAGAGTQGSLCGGGLDDWCAPGFVCVVGQRAGKRCAQLCALDGEGQCGGGLLCGELDVAGFGVCG